MRKVYGITVLIICMLVLGACDSKGGQSTGNTNVSSTPAESESITNTPTTNVSEEDKDVTLTPTPTEKAMKTVDFSDYVVVEFSGDDLAGYGSVSFDKEAYLLDNIHNVSFNKENLQVYREVFGNPDKSAASELLKYLDVKLDKRNKLSNGDLVEIVWDIDVDKISNYFVLDYVCSTKSYTVTGLTEAETFDPFEDLDVKISGISPYVEVSVYDFGYQRGQYTVSPNTNLKNGDEFTVSFQCDDKATMIEKYGEYPSCYEKTYTVSGRKAYVQSVDEIPEEQFDKLVDKASSSISILGYGLYEDAKYLGNVFYVAKDELAHGVHFFKWCGFPVGNTLCLVFEHPRDYYNPEEIENVYTVIVYRNLLIADDGTVSYGTEDIWSHGSFDTKDDVRKGLLGVFDDIMISTDNLLFE